MINSEWKEFGKEQPLICPGKLMWISNGKSIDIIYHYVDSWNTAEFFYWKWVEMPELPKHKLHSCDNGEYFCWQARCGGLFLDSRRADSTLIKIQFCPFCGYKPEVDLV